MSNLFPCFFQAYNITQKRVQMKPMFIISDQQRMMIYFWTQIASWILNRIGFILHLMNLTIWTTHNQCRSLTCSIQRRKHYGCKVLRISSKSLNSVACGLIIINLQSFLKIGKIVIQNAKAKTLQKLSFRFNNQRINYSWIKTRFLLIIQMLLIGPGTKHLPIWVNNQHTTFHSSQRSAQQIISQSL